MDERDDRPEVERSADDGAERDEPAEASAADPPDRADPLGPADPLGAAAPPDRADPLGGAGLRRGADPLGRAARLGGAGPDVAAPLPHDPASLDEPAPGMPAGLTTPPPDLDDWAPPTWADTDRATAADVGPRPEDRPGKVAAAPPGPARARPSVRPGALAFGLAFILLGVLGLLEPLDVDFETAWLWAVAPVALGLATMVAVIRRSLANGG